MKSQFTFFSGKGGVGKTSLACIAAVRSATDGRRTLIVTTDPASNLADVFEQKLGHQITPVTGVPNLWAMEIDADKAAEEYREHALGPIRAVFPPQIVQVMEEQMAGPCTTEVAAFDRFTDFLDDSALSEYEFDQVIFDTAPTGHTLRLLELPFEWSQTIDTATAGAGQTCLGPAAAIQDSKLKYDRAISVMRDPQRTTFVFVLLPEAIAIKETRRALAELERLKITSFHLIVNGVIPNGEGDNALFNARAEMQARYLLQIEGEFPVPIRRMSMLAGEIKGVRRLIEVGRIFFDGEQPAQEGYRPAQALAPYTPPQAILSRIIPDGHDQRMLFFTGKGGVGKTVASCATAVWLADHGYRTLLVTTDPAAHLGDVLDVAVADQAGPVAGVAGLWAAKIDPKAAAEAYSSRILEDARQRGRSEQALQTMKEELDSPCTEEMAAFDRFIDFASQANWQVIVFDTAPTGHTLRLIELPVDWSQQLDVKIFASVDSNQADDVAKQRFGGVIAAMRDPRRSTFAYVMYPEATPILEAERAAAELGTVGIQAGLVVANMVIPPEATGTPFGQARRGMQEKYLKDIARRFPVPILQIPLLGGEVKGLPALRQLGKRIYEFATIR